MRDIDAMMADIGNLLGDASDDAEKVSGNGDGMNGVTGGGASFEWFDRDGEPASDGEPTDSGGSISATAPAIRAGDPRRRGAHRRDGGTRREPPRRSPRGLRGVLVRAGGGAPFAPERRALGLLSRVAAVADDDARLQLIVPFCVASAADGAAAVRAPPPRARSPRPRAAWRPSPPRRQGVSRVRLAEPVRPRQGPRGERARGVRRVARARARPAPGSCSAPTRARRMPRTVSPCPRTKTTSRRSARSCAARCWITSPREEAGEAAERKRRPVAETSPRAACSRRPRSCAAPPTPRAAAAAGGVADPDQSTAARVRAGGGPGADADERASDPPPPPRRRGRV